MRVFYRALQPFLLYPTLLKIATDHDPLSIDISQYSPQTPQSQRHLVIQLDAPAAAFPFPSPSASFIPPPMPGAHEFAVKPPPASAKGKRGSRGDRAIASTLGAGAEWKEKKVVETPPCWVGPNIGG
ncbi:hypothetical protein FIBSPDRAFT_281637 [Athelia psychrophila]|uniref:Uncharacterized protein n=1 Tax=Athelia psychrophila TaxID=1759441 RepID=A0A167XT36_9AGAM|nr:hypothetical protein FIBSPDRAFT_281637 [Fibularhizoctonia sp. CBS 109695]